MTSSPSSFFSVVDLEGRGKGCVASCLIPRGTVVITDVGLVGRPGKSLGELIVETVAGWESYAGADLAPASSGAARRGHEVVQRNSFGDGAGGEGEFFPVVSRLNHSCSPNCCLSPPSLRRGREVKVVASRDIAPGEELTLCYVKLVGPRDVRRYILKAQFGFECDCQRCKAGETEAERRAFAPVDNDALSQRYRQLKDRLATVASAAMARDCFKEFRAFLDGPELPAQCYIRFELTRTLFTFHQLSMGKDGKPFAAIADVFKDAAWLAARQTLDLLPEGLLDHGARFEALSQLLTLISLYPTAWEQRNMEAITPVLTEAKRVGALFG